MENFNRSKRCLELTVKDWQNNKMIKLMFIDIYEVIIRYIRYASFFNFANEET